MPKLASRKSFSEIKKLKRLGLHSIGYVPGLCVRVSPFNKTYVYRYQVERRDRVLTMGSIYILELKDAIAQAMEYKVMLLKGEDPVLNKKRKREEMLKRIDEDLKEKRRLDKNLFYLVASEFLAYRKSNGAFSNNDKAESNALSMLRTHAYPILKDYPIADITPEHICSVLSKIWRDQPSLSQKLLILLKQIFDYAKAKNYYASDNPARLTGPLKTLLEPYGVNRKPVQHFASLDFHEIPEFMQELWQHDGLAAKGLMFSILTATRSKAVRFMTWDQLDLKNSLWEIPRENDKTKKENSNRTIFLSPQAKFLLKSIPRKVDLIFTNQLKLTALSDAAFGKVIKDINEQRRARGLEPFVDRNILTMGKPTEITQHGTARATFKTWAKDDVLGNNRRFFDDAVELCLLHTRADPLKGAYDRTKLEKERRQIMEEWGMFCCSKIDEFK